MKADCHTINHRCLHAGGLVPQRNVSEEADHYQNTDEDASVQSQPHHAVRVLLEMQGFLCRHSRARGVVGRVARIRLSARL